MFGDVLDRRKPLLTIKILRYMHGRQIGFFVQVSVVHKFGPKFGISSLLVLGQNRPENCVW